MKIQSPVTGMAMPTKLGCREIMERAREARRLSSPCRLCPRQCGVARVAGEQGYCGAGPIPAVAAVLPHFGEEPPLTADGGAGTIFFTRCNLRCVYCQNHQISQEGVGSEIIPRALAREMMHLQAQGCANVEAVSPSHHLPGFLEALAIAVGEGLDLPLVYNTNGYESTDTLDLLDGVVDVYLPDLKYADCAAAAEYSDALDYVERARAAILSMHAQVGNLVVDTHGRAVRGLILRHLVLPLNASGTIETLQWIEQHLPRTVTVSLMAQYLPLHRSREFPVLSRRITSQEYDEAVDLAWDLGLENVFIQDLDSPEVGIPDFCSQEPFRWK
jgi:putative pyruvate formate lyase activating enzyme